MGLRALREVKVQDIKAGKVIQHVGSHGEAGSRGGFGTGSIKLFSESSKAQPDSSLI